MIGNVNPWHAGYPICNPVKGSFNHKGVPIHRLRTTLLDDDNTLWCSQPALEMDTRRFWCPVAPTYVQCGKDILWVGVGAYQNGMSPGGWAPAVTYSEEPWPTSSLNRHKLLFCLESHMDAQASEECVFYFWQTPPPMTVSFENIPELVKPQKTYRGIEPETCPCPTSAPSSVTLGWHLIRHPGSEDSQEEKPQPTASSDPACLDCASI